MNSAKSYSGRIAIIGIAGRFPGSPDIEHFWRQLCEGRDALRHYSAEEVRAGIEQHDYLTIPYLERQIGSGNWVGAGYYLADVDKFDAGFFGYSPNEAELIDPQQRIFLEASWAAMEDAGYVPDAYPGAVGTFGGTGLSRYFLNNVFANREIMCASERDLIAGIGNEPDYLTNRVAYKLNFTGPSVTVQTACSTSLVAIHLACQALRAGECDLALGGGAMAIVPNGIGYQYQEGSMNSGDGRVRAFDAEASGTVFSEGGVGVIVLKRLEDAEADGDNIYAVIRGSAVTNDGNHKAGYTAPGIDGQVDVITRALRAANTHANEITYVEAHGTGTSLGDPIELTALTRAFRSHTDRRQYCAIGSVKTNVGHLAPAAGVASVIKAALAAYHGMLPPSLHYKHPNPRIDFADSPFTVNTELTHWIPPESGRRVASVSSFGIGGTNAHLILEEPPELSATHSEHHLRTIQLSAKTPGALARSAERLVAYLERHPETDLDDVALTLQEGRRAFDLRAAIACEERDELLKALAELAANPPKQAALPASGKLALMFTGQGSQHAGMATALHKHCTTFREVMDTCCELLAGHLELDLRRLLLASPDDQAAQDSLRETRYAQPALFVVEYALAQQLLAYQIQPAAMIGHSLGEYVAATLAGVFELEDALGLVALRGRLMQAMEPGAMLSIPLDGNGVAQWLSDEINLAAINSPRASVVAGSHAAIDALASRLETEGVGCRKLQTSHAFHSWMMKPLAEQFRAAVAAVPRRAPTARVVSNLTGDWLSEAQAIDPHYWVQHLLSPVRFQACLETLLNDGYTFLVEAGPGGVLSAFARHLLANPNGRPRAQAVPMMPHPTEAQRGDAYLRQALGNLWAAGYGLDFAIVEADNVGRRIPLPAYPFARERHWLDAPKAPAGLESEAGLKRSEDLGDWFNSTSWRRQPWLHQQPRVEGGLVLILGNDSPTGHTLGVALCEALVTLGARVARVQPDTTFTDQGEGRYALALSDASQWEQLLAHTGRPQAVIHTLLLDATGGDTLENATLTRQFAFDALLALTQALADEAADERVALLTLGSEMFDVVPGETIDAVKASAIGPHLAIGHEYRKLVSRALDVPAGAAELPHNLARITLDELARLQAEAHAPLVLGDKCVAWRHGSRWLGHVETVPVATPAIPVDLAALDGAIIITGGLGGIGLSFAETLVRHGARQLVLVGRSPLPAPEEWASWVAEHGTTDATSGRIAAIRKLITLGAEVEAEACDITQADTVIAMVERVRVRFDHVAGAIHAAGVAGSGVMAMKSLEAANAVLDPKIVGALALERALEGENLSFFVLVSSLFAVIGGTGQVDYCAANNFLDAFARSRAARGLHTVSLAYGGWREVGMAVAMGHTGATKAPALPAGRSETHPFLFSREQDGATTRFTTYLRVEDQWALSDHRINGVPVMPGTGLIEMLRAAWQALTGQATCTLGSVFFYRPLFVPENEMVEVHLTLTPTGDAHDVEIVTEQGPVLVADVQATSGEAAIIDVAKLNAACNDEVVEFGGQAALIGEQGFLSLGERWQVVQRMRFGENQLLGELALPAHCRADLEQFSLHPALLDMATGPITGHLLMRLDLGLDSEYLPFTYGRLDIHGAMEADLLTHVVYRGIAEDRDTIHFDIRIFTAEGRLVASVEDFRLRRVPAEAFAAKAGPLVGATDDGSISPQEGCEALLRVLALDGAAPHWVFSPHPLETMLRRMRAERIAEATRGDSKKAKLVREDVIVAPPTTPEEEILVAIIEEALGITPVGIHDNFFDLGIDSVIGIQIVAHAKKHGVILKPNQLFEHQTVAELAAVASRAATAPVAPAPAAAVVDDLGGADLSDVLNALGAS